ncbi:Endonuclease/exonuclease/phosphatase [Trema orientale]|uniref:Endonuclease/exonuclease/phosphatase n=1 Tax=Trema orientale TaxID=63057 RepID=A0A2P5EVC8_TREOI|nr:Endonuclease/exonuclease/phosphatase [Trema orientale]
MASARFSKFVRIRVNIDISKSLCRGSQVSLGNDTRPIWVDFRYERLPEVCFIYSRVGHALKECSQRRDVDVSAAASLNHGTRDQFWGAGTDGRKSGRRLMEGRTFPLLKNIMFQIVSDKEKFIECRPRSFLDFEKESIVDSSKHVTIFTESREDISNRPLFQTGLASTLGSTRSDFLHEGNDTLSLGRSSSNPMPQVDATTVLEKEAAVSSIEQVIFKADGVSSGGGIKDRKLKVLARSLNKTGGASTVRKISEDCGATSLDAMKTVAWNAWGLGSAGAFKELRGIIRSSQPSLVFLIETHLYGRRASFIKRKIGFLHRIIVDSVEKWAKNWVKILGISWA